MSDTTFEEFQATRKTVEDLGSALKDEWLFGHPGLLYLDALYIETKNDSWIGFPIEPYQYYLVIGNSDWASDNLEELERKLYEFAVNEGYTQKETGHNA